MNEAVKQLLLKSVQGLLAIATSTSIALPAVARCPENTNNNPNPRDLVIPETQVLKLGEAIADCLAGNEIHAYQIRLDSGMYFKVVVEQQGADVVLYLSDLERQIIAVSDSPNHLEGKEPISGIADEEGVYIIEIHPFDVVESDAEFNYTIALESYRQATDRDRALVAAERAFMKGNQLHFKADDTSQREAIAQWEKALTIYREIEDYENVAFLLQLIGDRHDNLGEVNEAIERYQASLSIYQQLNRIEEQADLLSRLAWMYEQQENYSEVISSYQNALDLWQQVGDRSSEALSLRYLADTFRQLKDYERAIDRYETAIAIFQEVGDSQQQAIALNNAALAYAASKDYRQAIAYYQQALEIERLSENLKGQSIILGNLGDAYRDSLEPEAALVAYNDGLEIAKNLDNRDWEALLLNRIGDIYYHVESGDLAAGNLEAKDRAIAFYTQALDLYRELGNRRSQALVLNNLGSAYSSSTQYERALEEFNQALAIYRELEDGKAEALSLYYIGNAYSHLDDSQTALDYFTEALPLSEAAGDFFTQALTLHGIGAVYSDLGAHEQALEYYERSLPIARTHNYSDIELTTLHGIGKVYSDLGESEKALEYYHQSLAIGGSRQHRAVTLSNIAAVYDALGDWEKALAVYEESLSLARETGDLYSEATILNNLGYIHNVYLKDFDRAIQYHQEALALYRQTGVDSGQVVALYNLASLALQRGQFQQGLTSIEEAIALIENRRATIASEDLRTTFFSSQQIYYKVYIDVLMQLHQQQPEAGYDAQALAISEAARARSLIELLAEANTDIRQGVDPQLLDRERELQSQIDRTAQTQVELLSGEHTREQAAAIAAELDRLVQEYKALQAQIRATSPRYADLTQPETLTLEQIQRDILDEETLLLEYALGTERSYLWVVSKTELKTYILPSRNEIEEAAREFRKAAIDPKIRHNEARVAGAALKLSEIILDPIAAELEGQRLLVVADGALQYVPFGALPIPGRAIDPPNWTPLLVEHEIVNLPSASTLSILRRDADDRPRPSKTIAAIADPVFASDDARLNPETLTAEQESETLASADLGVLTRSANGVGISLPPSRLIYTRDEVKKILSLVPESESYQALDFEANRETVASDRLADYRIIHLATHGFLNSANPELSGLILSLVNPEGEPENGFLRLHDVYNLQWPVEMVVLSACETGLGQDIRGEGIVGLTRGFMYAGAQRVVVSLWSVNDEGTSVLMGKFYQKMLADKLAPAAALRAAQLEMWNDEQWRSPFYWAAFVLQGEWQ
jgi:CHAT domain-containing protein/predicted DNA-binding protein YlxM (UPF0122 family)